MNLSIHENVNKSNSNFYQITHNLIENSQIFAKAIIILFKMIKRITPSKQREYAHNFSCCGISDRNQAKNQAKVQLKLRTISKPLIILGANQMHRKEGITVYGSKTPKHINNSFAFGSKEESQPTRPTSTEKEKWQLNSPPAAQYSIKIKNSQYITNPLIKLNLRRGGEANKPIKFNLTEQMNFNSPNINFKSKLEEKEQNYDLVKSQSTMVLQREINQLQSELRSLQLQYEGLKQQKIICMQKYKFILLKLYKKQEEIRKLEQLRRQQIDDLKKELKTMMGYQ